MRKTLERSGQSCLAHVEKQWKSSSGMQKHVLYKRPLTVWSPKLIAFNKFCQMSETLLKYLFCFHIVQIFNIFPITVGNQYSRSNKR